MKYTLILLLIIQMIVLVGCEDDAILEPQTEDECTGSYCSLSFPGIKTNSTHENPSVF